MIITAVDSWNCSQDIDITAFLSTVLSHSLGRHSILLSLKLLLSVTKIG